MYGLAAQCRVGTQSVGSLLEIDTEQFREHALSPKDLHVARVVRSEIPVAHHSSPTASLDGEGNERHDPDRRLQIQDRGTAVVLSTLRPVPNRPDSRP